MLINWRKVFSMKKRHWRNTTETFGTVSKLFHWVVGIGLIGMLIVGFYMAGLDPSPQKFQLIFLHKSTGAVLLVLIFLRLVWRLNNPNPKLPDTLNPVHYQLARLSIPVLYLAMFIMPLSGYVMSEAAGYPVSVYGLFNLPDLIGKNPELAKTAFLTHVTMAYIFIGLLVIHTLAALFHHFVLKDNVMVRMLPFRSKRLK